MTIMVDGQEKRGGLTLSGGGFRAAAFRLGVFRYLQARDITTTGMRIEGYRDTGKMKHTVAIYVIVFVT